MNFFSQETAISGFIIIPCFATFDMTPFLRCLIILFYDIASAHNILWMLNYVTRDLYM